MERRELGFQDHPDYEPEPGLYDVAEDEPEDEDAAPEPVEGDDEED
jgi:hypothetical protein